MTDNQTEAVQGTPAPAQRPDRPHRGERQGRRGEWHGRGGPPGPGGVDPALRPVTERLRGGRAPGEIAAEDLMEAASALGEHLARRTRLRAAVLRRFVGELRRVAAAEQDGVKRECQFLRPLLAHAAARDQAARAFQGAVDPLLSRASTVRDAQAVRRFVDATLAFHAFHGGRTQ